MKAGPAKRLLVPLVGLLFLTLLSLALVNLSKLVNSTRPPSLYIKDFNVEYVMARATLKGESPYKPLPELARFADGYTAEFLQHPSPHPPPVIFVGIPFTGFDLGSAALLWLLIELVCVAAASALMLKAVAGRVTILGVAILFCVWLAWHPFEREMFWGQLMIPTLALTTGAWVALQSRRDMAGGALLGIALAIKLFGWPIILFLVIMRRWRAALGAAISFASLSLAAALVIGFGEVVAYYVTVGPAVSRLYRAMAGNFSLWSLGPRMFDVGGDDWYTPLINIPSLATIVSLATVACVLTIALKAAIKADSFDSAFCALACVSIVINPIAWSHYLVLTAPALCLVAWRITRGRLSHRNLLAAGVVLVMGLLLEYTLPAVMALSPRIPGARIPFIVSTITYLPLVFVVLVTRVTLIRETRPDDCLTPLEDAANGFLQGAR